MLAASLFPNRFSKPMACVVFNNPADVAESESPARRLAARRRPKQARSMVVFFGYPGVVLLNSTRVPTRVYGPYRSKNTTLGVFRIPGGVLGTCFAL
jgi:hypothetical protein